MATARRPVADPPLDELSDGAVLAALLAPANRRWQGLEAEGAALLADLGGWQRVARMGPGELALAVDGRSLGTAARRIAWRLACALELGRRAGRVELPQGPVVSSAGDLVPHLRGYFAGRLKETFVVVLLDAKHRPVRTERVSEGCLTWSVVHPREVFAPAVRESAGAIIVAHNHPSGDPSPSRQDIEVTLRLVRAGETLGIPLLDHVVVGQPGWVSLRARGHFGGASGAT